MLCIDFRFLPSFIYHFLIQNIVMREGKNDNKLGRLQHSHFPPARALFIYLSCVPNSQPALSSLCGSSLWFYFSDDETISQWHGQESNAPWLTFIHLLGLKECRQLKTTPRWDPLISSDSDEKIQPKKCGFWNRKISLLLSWSIFGDKMSGLGGEKEVQRNPIVIRFV